MISLTAINLGKTAWWDDLPPDQNPFNPDNRDRMVELFRGLKDSDIDSTESPTEST